MSGGAPRPTLFTQVTEYWSAYGGLKALARSEFIWFSIFLTLIGFEFWTKEDWWSFVLQTVPTLMGLSLAALTLFLGAGSEEFRSLIAGQDPTTTDKSPFIRTAAVFVHFMVIQSIALLAAFLASSIYKIPCPELFSEANELLRIPLWGLGFFFFVYSLFSVLAATFAIFEVVTWFDSYITEKKKSRQ